MEDEFARGSVERSGAGWVSEQKVVSAGSVLSDGASQLVAPGEVGELELPGCLEGRGSVDGPEAGWGWGTHTLCLGEKLLGQVACYNHLPSLFLLNVLGLVEV